MKRIYDDSLYERLEKLADTLYEPFRGPVQHELDFDANLYAEVADCVVERPIARFGDVSIRGYNET